MAIHTCLQLYQVAPNTTIRRPLHYRHILTTLVPGNSLRRTPQGNPVHSLAPMEFRLLQVLQIRDSLALLCLTMRTIIKAIFHQPNSTYHSDQIVIKQTGYSVLVRRNMAVLSFLHVDGTKTRISNPRLPLLRPGQKIWEFMTSIQG